MIREYSVQVVTRMTQYRTGSRFETRLTGILVLATWLTLATPLAAQVRAQLQDGVLIGMVREAGSGAGVPFALIKLPARELQLFATEGGRFSIAGLSPGEYAVEVRQIGFAPANFRLQVLPAGALPALPALRSAFSPADLEILDAIAAQA